MHPGYHTRRVHVELHVHTINQIVTQLQEQNGDIFTRKWIALPRITLILSGYYPVEGYHKHSVKPHSSKPKIINLSSTFLLATWLFLLATIKLIGWGKATNSTSNVLSNSAFSTLCMQHVHTLFALSCCEVLLPWPSLDLDGFVHVLCHHVTTFAFAAEVDFPASHLPRIAPQTSDVLGCVPQHQNCQSKVLPYPLQALLHPPNLRWQKSYIS